MEFFVDLLTGAMRAFPVATLLPLVFAAVWTACVIYSGNRALLKRGLKGFTGMVAASLLLLFLLVPFSLGAIGGHGFGKGMEVFAVVLFASAVLLYIGVVPFLVAISWKGIMRGPRSLRPDSSPGSRDGQDRKDDN